MTAVTKSSLRLYRDCLRAIRHASARSPKAAAMTELVRDEFRKHKDVQSFDKINQLKQAAWEGIQNYVVLRSFA